MAPLAVLIAALSAPLPDNPNPWVMTEDSDALKIWQRDVPGSDTQQVRVETILSVSSRQLWSVIRDVKSYHEFMPNMAEARILRETGNVRLVYQRVSPPVVDDRDYTLRAVAYEDHEHGLFQQDFTIANDQGPRPKEGVVRVETVAGGWLLEPLGANKTRIVYWLHTDPGGWVPSWAINIGQSYSLPALLESLENRARDPTWRL